ncbi:MATE family efflux transporter [Bacilliculturomica massiliensis]|uniref:MATE family efflux transporter n=1 Tax=Bacilliculturomica massiliensis TaxID=1917867 RepID=UPI0010301D22|nr:MATE family efflux transporter [Bacilliculturomica massiliensis]
METVFTQRQTYPQFLRFIFPSIMSMIAISFYTTIDGFFVSRFVGPEALASINIIVPFTCVVYGIALMLSSGAGAYVSMKMGERKKEEADSLFTFTVAALTVIALILTVISLVFLQPILRMLGSTDVLMPYTIPYGFVTVLMTLPMMLKLFFEYFARVDGNPNLAFVMSTAGLILNIVLDFLFIVPMKMGILGAALGTFASIAISGAMGLWYFMSRRSVLRFTKPKADFVYLGKSCINGSSQLLTELSTGVVTFLFNIMILKYEGELGVAAVSIIMFLYYFFIAVYMGLSAGAAPIISYSYGAKNTWRSRLVLRHSYISLLWMSLLIFAVSFAAGPLLIRIFSTDATVIQIAEAGNRLFSLCYLFAGVNVFMAALFTAVGNGTIAAIISTLRCLVFSAAAMLLLPMAIGEPGTWLAIPVAEFLTLFFAVFFYLRYKSGILPEDGEPACSANSGDIVKKFPLET